MQEGRDVGGDNTLVHTSCITHAIGSPPRSHQPFYDARLARNVPIDGRVTWRTRYGWNFRAHFTAITSLKADMAAAEGGIRILGCLCLHAWFTLHCLGRRILVSITEVTG